MKVKVLVSGAAYLILLAGLLISSSRLAIQQLGPADYREASRERFGIYLSSTGDLVISDADIVSYNQTSHTMILSESGIAKIRVLGMIPVNGTGFVVKVDGEVVLTGAFWTPISSIDYKGIALIIEIPAQAALTFQLGYPPRPSEGPDPRGDPRITNVFRSLGKLVQ